MSNLKLQNRPSRRRIPAITLIGVLLIVALAAGLYISHQQYLPVDPDDQKKLEVRIPDNSSARQVAASLKQHDLIKSERAFLRYCKKNDLDSQLKAGTYELQRSQSVAEIAAIIASGRTAYGKITIPEGYTVKQIGELLVTKEICSSQEFQEALASDYPYEFLPAQDTKPERLEGYLFPDTYAVDEDMAAKQLLNLMLKRFAGVWNEEFADQAAQKGMSVNEVITIASLIEREAQVPSERTRISGVIQNRLKAGMPLQIDATVLYAMGRHQEQVFYQDLKVDSPYNTYKYPGLPPGPIASPGKAAIKAALNPEQHSYLYYVSKGDGSHHFSKTYAEHLQAKKKYGL